MMELSARTRTRTAPEPSTANEYVEPAKPLDTEAPITPDATFEEPEKEKPKTELEKLRADAAKRFGPGIIRPARHIPPFPSFSTGAFTLDFALMGGIPETLMTLLFGNESSGKTTIMYRMIAGAQRKHPEKRAAIIDFEGTADMGWAERHGVDLDRLELVQPDTGEDGVDLIEGLIEAWDICAVGFDSVAMATPHKIIVDSASDHNVSPLAKLWSIGASKIVRALNKQRRRQHYVTAIGTNQFRSKIGVMFGDPRILPGGRAINDYVPMTKLELKSKEVMGEDQNKIAVVSQTDHSFLVKKCKTGLSIRAGEFQMAVSPDHDLGFGTLLDAPHVAAFALKMGFITGKPQNWRLSDVEQKFRGKEEIHTFLYANPDEMLRLKQRIISKQRVLKGLPALPADGFLLDWNARENLAA